MIVWFLTMLSSFPFSVMAKPATDEEPELYFNPVSHYSALALVALAEKKAAFNTHSIDLSADDQLQRWFLLMNPKGEVPVLKDKAEVVCGSMAIMDYADSHFGRPNQLFPAGANADDVRALVNEADGVNVFRLTYGVANFHTHGNTDLLRWPYYTDKMQIHRKNAILARPAKLRMVAQKHKDIPAGPALAEKATNMEDALELFNDRKRFASEILRPLEAFLDKIEARLASDDHTGPWLCGPAFTAADASLSVLLVRLHRLGLDERYWLGGVRPHLTVYQELAFRRPSVERACGLKEHAGQYMRVQAAAANGDGSFAGDQEGNPALDAAKIGLGALLVLGGIYGARKLWKK